LERRTEVTDQLVWDDPWWTTLLTVSGGDRDRVAAYLPDNYVVVGVDDNSNVIVIGRDKLGWTAKDYVVPRLASGLMFAKISHRIPLDSPKKEDRP
jgi:hypothetical protein